MSKIKNETMFINDITIEAEHAGNIAYYRSLSQFDSLESFNEHFRKLTYTYAELLDQKPSIKAVLSALFKLGAKTFGVAFPKRETLAKAAGVSSRSVDNFIKAASTFGIIVEKALGRKDKRFGGYAHNIYIFSPSDELLELPSEKVDCEASCEASLQGVDMPEALEPQTLEAPISAPNQDSFKQDFPSELKDLKDIYKSPVAKATIISNELNENAIEIVAAKQNIDIQVLQAFSPFHMDYKELNEVAVSIKRTVKKHGWNLADYSFEIMQSIKAAFPTYKEYVQGNFKGSIIGYICGTIKNIITNSIEDANDQNDEDDYIIDNSFEFGYALDTTILTTEVSPFLENLYGQTPEDFYGSSDDMPW
ncbi:hypothetical protein EI200_18235 [Peribacillus simplex]|uniref:hypothetical protein n=1 Tax=Peribacillus simplex TaxID=1478 RepID=UPI000F64187F|nr:hypothetical protein [Peribacillus simplex]RRN68833.1 hypothetical protein EI200_18235 [Peribacillus simplex]